MATTAEIKPLTGIRGVAAVAVLLCHYSWQLPKVAGFGGLPQWLMASGWVWVDLFFILSGFIMMYAHKAGAQTLASYGAFLRKRLARIWPVHAITLTFAMVVFGPAGWGHLPSWFEYVRTFLLMHAWWNYSHPIWNGVNWSLSAEWGAYVLFPVVFYLTAIRKTKTLWRAFWLLMVATVVGHMVLANKNMGVIVECALFRSVPEFALGAMLYRFRERNLWVMAPETIVNLCMAGILTLVIALYALNFKAGYWLMIPLMAWLVYGLSFNRGSVARWLSGPTMSWLGAISFSLYMVHYVIMQAGFTLISVDELVLMPKLYGVGYIAILWALTVLVAWASYLWLETPAQRWLTK